MEIEGVEFNVLRAFHHELRVDALAWSPESRLDRIPAIRYYYFVYGTFRSGDIKTPSSCSICLCLDLSRLWSTLLHKL